jgi:hypothetical protein
LNARFLFVNSGKWAFLRRYIYGLNDVFAALSITKRSIEMLEPFGDFVVSTSDDFAGDLWKIADELNEYSWSGNNVKWGVYKNRWGVHLMTDAGEFSSFVPIPTLFPEVVTAVYVEQEDGKSTLIQNPTYEDCEIAHEFVFDTAPLMQIAEKVAPFIESGCLEFSCWITEVHQGLSLERMKIFSDGRAERSRVISGAACSYENVIEAVQI